MRQICRHVKFITEYLYLANTYANTHITLVPVLISLLLMLLSTSFLSSRGSNESSS